jgi:hypothetical protein
MEDILISLLPIFIVVVVWIVIMKFVVKKNLKNNIYIEKQEEMIVLLREIKEELKQINQINTSK